MADNKTRAPTKETPPGLPGPRLSELVRRLAKAEAALQAMAASQVDAVIDPASATPVLLRQAQAALQESEARYRQLVESMSDGLAAADAGGVITFVNRRFCDMLQLEPEAALGQKFIDFLDEANRARWLAHQEKRRQGLSSSYDLEFTRTDGSRVFVQAAGSPLFDTHGNFAGSVGVLTDMTERRQAEESLRASEAQFRAVFENAPVGISLLDPERKLTESNLALERITRMTKAGLLAGAYRGRKYLRPDGTEMPPDEFASAHAISEKQPVRNVETGIVTEDGRVIWTQVSAAPMDLSTGRIVVITEDITERKQTEEKIRASLAEKEALLREVHHRVKNNLEVIISLAELQIHDLTDTSAIHYLRELQARVRAIAQVHESLYQSSNLARVMAEKYLNRLAASLAQLFGAPGAQLRVAAPDIILSMDTAISLGLVVTELLTNACKYAFPPGAERSGIEPEIRVSLRAEAGQLILEVADNGVGLPPGLDWQNVASLGLRLVDHLARQLGGQLEVGPPPGARFRLAFRERGGEAGSNVGHRF